ncbi:MAG: glycosyltransferase family 2 protein, partial [Muribaculaceae bacterium]|nr:glycosyltransferase family 2 protein [Muribaculaceae bacterium]
VEVLSESTPGAASARNAGLARVDTPWVMFFDSDDTMRTRHCARAMEAASPDTDILGWNVNIRLSGSRRIGRFVGANCHFDNLFHGGFATLRWCARTETVRRAGAWNPQVMIWDDIELGSRLIESGAAIKRLGGEPSVDVEFSEVSMSNEPWLSRLCRIEAVLSIIEATLPHAEKHYASVKLALAAGEAMRESRDDAVRQKARRIYRKALSGTHGLRHRLSVRLAFYLIRHVPRGVVPLLSLFMK